MPLSSTTTHDILKKVQQIQIHTRHLVSSTLSGAYHSTFKGQGIDFEEIREYTIGDDPKLINWMVSARMDKPFIKKYREDRQLCIFLAVDLSASIYFGSSKQSKRELAAQIASVLAFSAILNQDKVGLLLFTDQIEVFVPPKKGKAHILRIIREVLFFEPKGKRTNISLAVEKITRMLKSHAIVFLISDFLGIQDLENFKKKLTLANKKQDWIAIRLSDPREATIPPCGILRLQDAETGELHELDTHCTQTLGKYTLLYNQSQSTIKQIIHSSNIDFIDVCTGKDYILPLKKFFSTRKKTK